MKIEDFRDAYYEASAKTSEITRHLAFAGIAIIWILKVGTNSGGIPFSTDLIGPLYWFAIALAADLGQYIYKTIAWGLLNWINWEKHKDNTVEVTVYPVVNLLSNVLFWGKVVAVVYGYACLLAFIRSWL